jgi:hypothetical protein
MGQLTVFSFICFKHPYPKGEVFIGHRDGDFSVSMGCTDSCNTQGYVFTLHTPDRDFILSADTREDMNQWICALQRVTELPMTPQDNRCMYAFMIDFCTRVIFVVPIDINLSLCVCMVYMLMFLC